MAVVKRKTARMMAPRCGTIATFEMVALIICETIRKWNIEEEKMYIIDYEKIARKDSM